MSRNALDLSFKLIFAVTNMLKEAAGLLIFLN